VADPISPIVFMPKNLTELMAMYRHNPHALLWAGGTAIAGFMKNTPQYKRVGKIISLEMVTEISKVSRTERYLEIGAKVPYNRILQVGQHVLPPPLNQALSQLRPLSLRNLATIGGNLSVQGMRLNLYPVLMLLDTRVELRRETKSRWIDVQRLYDRSGNSTLEKGELITRLRIPFEEWDIGYFRQTGSPARDPRAALLFCCTGKMVKGIISDFRCAFGTYTSLIIRNREMEAFLTGKKVPFSRKDREDAAEMMNRSITGSPGISSFQKHRAQDMVAWFLDNLRDRD
jgi:CO/xanthine dehydrogenase FAD-binding subunit